MWGIMKRVKLAVLARSAWRFTRRFPVSIVMCSLALPVAALLLLTPLVNSLPGYAFPHAFSGVPVLEDPDTRCAGCHAEIYRRYQLTAMGRGSGAALQGFLPGDLQHALSDVHYRVFLRDGSAWMSFHRDRAAPKGELDGERKLEYFVGSGRRGRTFLLSTGESLVRTAHQLLHPARRLGYGSQLRQLHTHARAAARRC